MLAQVASEAGLAPGPLRRAALEPAVQQEFARNSDDAVAMGVFGSPTYVVDAEMFYGQDRLVMVERALRQPFRSKGPAPRW